MAGILSGLESYWLFEPFARVALDTVGVWYAIVLLTMMAITVTVDWVFDFDPDVEVFPDRFGLAQMLLAAVVVAPIVEEMLFRILPHLFGWPFGIMLLLTLLWVLLHGIRAPIIAMFAPIYLKLVLGGFLIEAILLHAIHNLIGTIVHYYIEDD